MLIRFVKFTQAGPAVQINAGELLDLPQDVAQQHIDDGNAVKVSTAEFATMPRHEFAQPIPVRAAVTKKSFRGRR